MKRTALVLSLLAAAGTAQAAKDPVSVGGGVYMLTDRNFTIFGSADGIVAKLMTQANKYCQRKTGGDAEMVDSAGSEAVPGELQHGQLKRAAQGATGTVYFKCAGAAPTVAAAAPATTGRFLQVRQYGDVGVQVSLPDDGACKALVASATGATCSPTSASAALKVRALLEDAQTKDVITVEGVGPATCEEFVKGFTSGSGLTVLQPCREK